MVCGEMKDDIRNYHNFDFCILVFESANGHPRLMSVASLRAHCQLQISYRSED